MFSQFWNIVIKDHMYVYVKKNDNFVVIFFFFFFF